MLDDFKRHDGYKLCNCHAVFCVLYGFVLILSLALKLIFFWLSDTIKLLFLLSNMNNIVFCTI